MKTTSIEAFESIKPERPRLHNLIISGLRKIKKGTFREIARASNLRESQVWKRLSELKTQGIVTEDNVKKCPVSGRKITVWKLINPPSNEATG